MEVSLHTDVNETDHRMIDVSEHTVFKGLLVLSHPADGHCLSRMISSEIVDFVEDFIFVAPHVFEWRLQILFSLPYIFAGSMIQFSMFSDRDYILDRFRGFRCSNYND